MSQGMRILKVRHFPRILTDAGFHRMAPVTYDHHGIESLRNEFVFTSRYLTGLMFFLTLTIGLFGKDFI